MQYIKQQIQQGVVMITSESIKELAQALAKAQGQMAAALKDSNNPFFKSKYADISSVIDAMRKPFADNGLAFIQAPYTEGDKTYLSARIIHASGEWIEFAGIHVPVVKLNDAQALKSGLTYMRRAQMLAVCCIEESDDDGNAAVSHQTRPQSSGQAFVQKTAQTSAPPQKPAAAPVQAKSVEQQHREAVQDIAQGSIKDSFVKPGDKVPPVPKRFTREEMEKPYNGPLAGSQFRPK